MNRKIVVIYSSIHFVVDLSCAVLITNAVAQKMGQTSDLFTAILMYNFFAFAMQFPIGIIADKINKNAICSAIGCLLVAAAFGFSSFAVIACVIAGIGNALFHIGGGIDILNISDKKARFSGIFVSTGAMGIFLGSRSSLLKFDPVYMMVLILLGSAATLGWLYHKIQNKITNTEVILPKLNATAMSSVACLVITVCIRSYVGLILAFEWKNSLLLASLSILAVVFGKMLGGMIGDKIGFLKISVISLTVSAICFIFAFNSPILGISAMLFFNMTMPITLTALSNLLENKGMAFGLLTFALFIGALPTFFGYTKLLFTPVGLFAVTLFSAVILYIGIQKYNLFTEQRS